VPEYNCTYSPGSYRTLAALRTDIIRRLGYSAQAANPPPGMAPLVDSFLQDAQKQLYRQYNELRTERFFTWTMVPGERYYDVDGDEIGSEDAAPFLDPYKISWVGVEDLNNVWLRLIQGIPPHFYTRTGLTLGLPTHYEIRSCIEVFPAPQEAYKLRIKGHFGLAPFDLDTDQATIDDHAVFLLALAQAKSHYGQRDAQQYFQQSFNYIANLVAGSHHTARYVPGSAQAENMQRPVFLPILEE
jgi:hypothetical protein